MPARTASFRFATTVATAFAAAFVMAACNKPTEAIVAAAGPVASAAAANVSDIDVTEHVKTALQRNERLQGFNITVETTNGDVRMNGVLNTQAQIDEALLVARNAEGVHALHDELTLKP